RCRASPSRTPTRWRRSTSIRCSSARMGRAPSRSTRCWCRIREEGPMTTLELDSPLAGLSGDAYRIAARDWLARNAPQPFLADRAGYTAPTVPELKQWEATLYRGGLAGIAWPSAYGGHGRTLAEHLIGNQEIGRLALPE